MDMREIKFRVWNGSEMVYDIMVGKFGVFYVNPSNNGLDEKDSASITPFNTKYPDDSPVMQFTGLKDKNGKDIYEGDILGCETLKGIIPGWVIVYSNEYSGFRMRQVDRIKPTNVQNKNAFCRYPVIGNIYENPELLPAIK